MRSRAIGFAVAAALFASACWTRDDSTSTTHPGPTGTGTTPTGGGTALDDARQYNLQRINAYRAQNGAGALVLDDALDTFAQAGSTELSQDHQPHQNFTAHYATCGCNVNAENQGDQSGWRAAPVHDQIDEILKFMMDEGPGGGHHDNILNPQWRRLGVGVVNPGGSMYFTNDFGP